MQQVLRISRKLDYGLRAMIYLASIPDGAVVPFREIARRMQVPEDFLAKILKSLVDEGMVRSARGPHGGYQLARPAGEVSFLDIIEAVEGPVALNVCLDEEGCAREDICTMVGVWRLGQEKMLEVYRSAKLVDLKLPGDDQAVVSLGAPAQAR